MLWSPFPSKRVKILRFGRGTRRGTRFLTDGVAPRRGTLNVQHGAEVRSFFEGEATSLSYAFLPVRPAI
jgi:hypothetical protein